MLEEENCEGADPCRWRRSLARQYWLHSLLRQGEIRFALARNGDGLGLILRAFVPRRDRIAAIGNVFDLVVPAVVSLGEIRSWADHDVSRHLRMHVAEQRHDARLIERERTLLTLGPRAQIVSELLVAADRSPEDVVLHRCRCSGTRPLCPVAPP